MRGIADGASVSQDEARALLEPLTRYSGIILAVSGGPDSTALMGLCAGLKSDPGFPDISDSGFPDIIVATIDHGLRPESPDEAAGVAVLANALGLEHITLHWHGDKPATGLQEAARIARYGLLGKLMHERGAEAIALAHTLDDQAETVLMRLARGSGLRGLGGMQPATKRDGMLLLRPLLGVPKSRLITTCEARGWPFFRDPSNDSARFLRPRLRRLLPALAEEGLTAERLASFARRAMRADQSLTGAAARALAAAKIVSLNKNNSREAYMATIFLDQGEEIALRMVENLIRRCTSGVKEPLSLERLEALVARLFAAIRASDTFHGTLGGAKISFSKGVVTVRLAPLRRKMPLR